MNTNDILKSGYQTTLKAIEGLSETSWEEPDACGGWSIKDIIAHLTSFEAVLVDILRQLTDADAAIPALDRFFADPNGFNEREVQARRAQAAQTILAEYETHYGDTYDLEDFIVYTYYGHKREHSAQILRQRNRLGDLQAAPAKEEA